MNWTYLITFGIGIGLYLIGLGVWTLIKRHNNKKKFEKECKEKDEESKEQ